MRRNGITRLQMLLLFGAVVLVLWRTMNWSDDIEGVVVFAEMGENHLYHSGLRVDRDTEIVVSMAGSFESDTDLAPLAAYGWILNADTRDLVWRPVRERLVRDGVDAVVVDTIHIAAGDYNLYYTTVGPTFDSRSDAPFLGLKPYWTNDASKWSMSIRLASDEELDNPPIRKVDTHDGSESGEDVLWATGPVGNRVTESHLFLVSQPAELDIYAIGELCARECDNAYIESVRGGERIWEMTYDNTSPAGGADANREFSGTLALDAGVYRAGYHSNGSHSHDSWRANPPWNPEGWGLTITNIPRADVTSYDPWTQTAPLIDLTGVKDDELRKVQFKVHRQSTFLISVMGEITSQRSIYDYGWLERNDSRETIWKMSYRNSNHAGGDKKNRVETVFLDLEAGTYTVYFQSDDSHSYERFNSTRPEHPERWGLAMFPVTTGPDDQPAYSVLDDVWTTEQPMDDVDAAAVFGGSEREALVQITGVGNEAELTERFELEDASDVYIVAAGEISTSGRYDYGWIERADSGERVWEMTMKNTQHAGGREQNRKFEGLVQLPAGGYIVRYESDFSHATGDFGGNGPEAGIDWGISIFRYSR